MTERLENEQYYVEFSPNGVYIRSKMTGIVLNVWDTTGWTTSVKSYADCEILTGGSTVDFRKVPK